MYRIIVIKEGMPMAHHQPDDDWRVCLGPAIARQDAGSSDAASRLANPVRGYLFWMVPFAATVLLVPCHAVSVLIEYWALSRLWIDVEKKKVFAAALRHDYRKSTT